MIRIQVPPAEVDRLEALFRVTPERKLRDRLQIVLMAHRGRPRQAIAADLGVDRRTVTQWVSRASGRGSSLSPRPSWMPRCSPRTTSLNSTAIAGPRNSI